MRRVKPTTVREGKKYAAKLLFQFRIVAGDGRSKRRRVCEERIILIEAESPGKALSAAKRRGRQAQLSYRDGEHKVFFEFIGVLDLVELGVESEPDKVWWKLTEMLAPMERRSRIIPAERDLSIFAIPSRRGRLKVP